MSPTTALVMLCVALVATFQSSLVESVVYPSEIIYGQNPYGNNVNLAANKSHHFVLGTARATDRQLFRQIYQRKGSFLSVTKEYVNYPSNGTFSYYTITAIRALDQYIDGNGGYATLLRGGVGYRNMTLELRSRRGKGFNFIVEVWGA